MTSTIDVALVPASAVTVTAASPPAIDVVPATPTAVEVNLTTPGPAGSAGAPGGQITSVAGENLGGHRVVRVTDDEAFYASCETLSDANIVLGVTNGAVSIGGAVTITRFGELSDVSFAWTLGSPVFLGVNGVLTQSLPGTAVFSQIVGFPMTATKLYVAPREPIII